MAQRMPHSTAEAWIGIVTVLYQSDEVIDGFMASLAAQRGVRFRLYVLDNSPKPTGAERCRLRASEFGIDAVVVFNNANLGVAKGNNQGIELGLRDGCTHILLANNDTEFGADTLQQLLNAVTADARAATAKLHYFGTQGQIWYAGGDIDEWRALVPHHGMREVDHGQFDQQTHTDYAPTCFMLFDAAVFQTVGLMDERYFVYYDDADFLLRYRRAGERIRFVPQALVQHKVSTSTGGDRSPFTLYWTHRNRAFFIRKNLRGPKRWFALGYFLLTRAPRLLALTSAQRERAWSGLRDGMQLKLAKA